MSSQAAIFSKRLIEFESDGSNATKRFAASCAVEKNKAS